jgi:hypothetical protein
MMPYTTHSSIPSEEPPPPIARLYCSKHPRVASPFQYLQRPLVDGSIHDDALYDTRPLSFRTTTYYCLLVLLNDLYGKGHVLFGRQKGFVNGRHLLWMYRLFPCKSKFSTPLTFNVQADHVFIIDTDHIDGLQFVRLGHGDQCRSSVQELDGLVGSNQFQIGAVLLLLEIMKKRGVV